MYLCYNLFFETLFIREYTQLKIVTVAFIFLPLEPVHSSPTQPGLSHNSPWNCTTYYTIRIFRVKFAPFQGFSDFDFFNAFSLKKLFKNEKFYISVNKFQNKGTLFSPNCKVWQNKVPLFFNLELKLPRYGHFLVFGKIRF